MDLKEIKALAESGRFDEAIAKCEKILDGSSEKMVEILRVRAFVYTLWGHYDKAKEDREAILGTGQGVLSDYYLAGDNALSSGNFSQASFWLREVLRLGQEQNENWFESAAYFLLAFAQMELGNYREAISNLDRAVHIDPHCAMPLPSLGTWDHNLLRTEIQRRASK
ncbi:MAG: tetratricopeptide repeat protein [Syntrophobacteraceae bacterium]